MTVLKMVGLGIVVWVIVRWFYKNLGREQKSLDAEVHNGN